MAKKSRRILIDELAATTMLRKPTAGPLIEPKEAVAVAISMTLPGPARLVSPDSPMVRLVLLSLKLAGYKIEPR